MSKDLLVQLLDIWIAKDKVPDELLMEFRGSSEEDNPVICCHWIGENKKKDYGHTEERYREAWYTVVTYWGLREVV